MFFFLCSRVCLAVFSSVVRQLLPKPNKHRVKIDYKWKRSVGTVGTVNPKKWEVFIPCRRVPNYVAWSAGCPGACLTHFLGQPWIKLRSVLPRPARPYRSVGTVATVTLKSCEVFIPGWRVPSYVAWSAGCPSVSLTRSVGLRPTSLVRKTLKVEESPSQDCASLLVGRYGRYGNPKKLRSASASLIMSPGPRDAQAYVWLVF